jgi:uncharacterized membrane protein YdbT with pleckstrin-like domain
VVAAIAVAVVVGLLTGVLTAVHVGAGLVAALLVFGFVKRMSTTYLVSSPRLYIRRGLLAKRVHQTRIDRAQREAGVAP